MKINSNLDINNNQIIKVRVESVSEFPTDNLIEGRIVYYTVDKKYYYYNGSEWKVINDQDMFIGEWYNGRLSEDIPENNLQITKFSITNPTEIVTDPEAHTESMTSNRPVSAKRVASTLNNLPYFINPSLSDQSDHCGYFISDKNANLTFLDTSSVANTYKNMDATKNKDMIPKIKADGDVTAYPFLVDNAWSKLTPSDTWSDVIPTSGCVINNVKNMAENILNNTTTDDTLQLFVVDRVSKETKLFDVSADAIHSADERILTSFGYNGLKIGKRIVNKEAFIDYSSTEEASCPLDDCVPTVSAVAYRDEYTYIVDSNETLERWLFGNDYSYDYSNVLIKAGEYTLSEAGTIQPLNGLIETHKISSSGEVTINYPSSVASNGLFYTTPISGVDVYDLNIEKLTLKVTGTNSGTIMSSINNISNSTFILDTDDNTNQNIILFDSCNNISNCNIKVNSLIEAGGINYVFNNCINISNIIVYFKMKYANYTSNSTPKLLFMNSCKNISDIYFKSIDIVLHGGSSNNWGCYVPKLFTLIQGCENVSGIVVDDYYIDLYKSIFIAIDNSINYQEQCVVSIICECTNVDSITVKNIKIKGVLEGATHFAILHRCNNVHDCNFDSSYLFESNEQGASLIENSDYLKSMISCIGIYHCINSAKGQKFEHCAGVERCSGYMWDCKTDYIRFANNGPYPDMLGCVINVENTSEGGYNIIPDDNN